MNVLKMTIILLLLTIYVACAAPTGPGKTSPEFSGVDPKVAPYVNEWLRLAQEKGIRFDNTVTVGIKDINRPNTVGLANYGWGFREIDIDRVYWNMATEMQKTTLTYHELGHMYCDRKHDYWKDGEYGDDGDAARKDPSSKDGFYADKCPISFMFPIILDDNCFLLHYSDYVAEMFSKCDPY